MARIRSLKPEFAKDETLAELPRDVRLHYALLWTYADDEGRGIDNPKLIKAELWPLDDDVTAEIVDGWQAELERAGRIQRYEADGKRVFWIVKFTDHQKPQHPATSKLPNPPEDYRKPHEAYANAHEDDRKPHAVVVEEGRVDGEGEEFPPVEFSAELELVSPAVSPTATDPVVLVFDAWQEATGRHRAVLDGKRRRVIKQALEHYPTSDLIDAVRGWNQSPHHRGENDRATVYNDIELLLRDAKHIEQFRDLTRHGPPSVLPKGMSGIAAFAARHQ